MQCKEYIKYSFTLFFKEKSIILILIIFFAVFEFIKGTVLVSNMFLSNMQPMYIKEVLHINTVEVLKSVDKVDFVFKYKMSIHTICMGEFSTKVCLIGIEDKEFLQIMEQDIYIQPSAAMPYVLIKEDLVNSLKNKEAQKLIIEDNKELLAKDIDIVIDDSMARKARICGIINEKNYKQINAFTSVINEDYEEIENIIIASIEDYDMITLDSTDSEKINNDLEEPYLVCISRGNHLNNVIDILKRNNVSVNMEIEQMLIDRSKGKENAIEDLLFGISLLINSVLVCKIKWTVWENEHKDFIEYINRPKVIRRLGDCYIAWNILIGGCIGICAYVVYCIGTT